MDRVEVLTCSIEEYMNKTDISINKVGFLIFPSTPRSPEDVLPTLITQDFISTHYFLQIGLSDVFEYMSEKASEATFALLATSAAPGCRVAFWSLFNHRLPSKSLLQSGKMTHLKALSEQLHQVDRVFFYSEFNVLQVN